MVVDSIETDRTPDGIDIFVWKGNVYVLGGEGAGSEGSFLGNMNTSSSIGRQTWSITIDKPVTKAVPIAEADTDFPGIG